MRRGAVAAGCLFDSESTMLGAPTGLAGDCAAWCTNTEDFPLTVPPASRGEYNSVSAIVVSSAAPNKALGGGGGELH
jgi:hypothetical protein